jgi:hypothetical protein
MGGKSAAIVADAIGPRQTFSIAKTIGAAPR